MDPLEETIDAVLSRFRSVAVVGISDNPARPSHEVAAYLLAHDFDVTPVNPRLREVLGRRCLPSLDALPPPLEVVVIFRRSEDAGAVVDEAIAEGARAVWLQEGVIDEAAAARARAAGLLVVMDRCMLKEHALRAARGGEPA